MDSSSRKFRDPRLDRITAHTLDIFAKQNKLGVLKTPTGLGIEHLNAVGSSNRFQRHDLPPQNPVAGQYSGLIRNKITLLSGSLKNESVEKPRKEEADDQSKIEKKIEEAKAESKVDGQAEQVRAELRRRR